MVRVAWQVNEFSQGREVWQCGGVCREWERLGMSEGRKGGVGV